MNINMAIGVTFAVCIFYTSLGGIKAVIWTNVFQAGLHSGLQVMLTTTL